ncbi:hypothetical protein ACWDBD_37110 [Streptomyces sp. NPDC001118]
MGMELSRVGDKIADTVKDIATYASVIARLGAASVAMLRFSEAVNGAYTYVENCAKSVDNLADTASNLDVDGAVISAHRDAAAVMRGVLADAKELSDAAAEMSRAFQMAKEEHEADYGPVHHAMTTKPGKVASSPYYSNR